MQATRRKFAEVREEAEIVPLRSGRTVSIDASGEEGLTVRSPTGEVELTIRFEASGPVVRISAAAIHLKSAYLVDVECERFQVRARESITLETEGETRLEGAGDTAINGRNILLNC